MSKTLEEIIEDIRADFNKDQSTFSFAVVTLGHVIKDDFEKSGGDYEAGRPIAVKAQADLPLTDSEQELRESRINAALTTLTKGLLLYFLFGGNGQKLADDLSEYVDIIRAGIEKSRETPVEPVETEGDA